MHPPHSLRPFPRRGRFGPYGFSPVNMVFPPRDYPLCSHFSVEKSLVNGAFMFVTHLQVFCDKIIETSIET